MSAPSNTFSGDPYGAATGGSGDWLPASAGGYGAPAALTTTSAPAVATTAAASATPSALAGLGGSLASGIGSIASQAAGGLLSKFLGGSTGGTTAASAGGTNNSGSGKITTAGLTVGAKIVGTGNTAAATTATTPTDAVTLAPAVMTAKTPYLVAGFVSGAFLALCFR